MFKISCLGKEESLYFTLYDLSGDVPTKELYFCNEASKTINNIKSIINNIESIDIMINKYFFINILLYDKK